MLTVSRTSIEQSHSTRVRGLKYHLLKWLPISKTSVALYTSAWIEMTTRNCWIIDIDVALYTSAWIEIGSDLTAD